MMAFVRGVMAAATAVFLSLDKPTHFEVSDGRF
jgi:hypothetical protein